MILQLKETTVLGKVASYNLLGYKIELIDIRTETPYLNHLEGKEQRMFSENLRGA